MYPSRSSKLVRLGLYFVVVGMILPFRLGCNRHLNTHCVYTEIQCISMRIRSLRFRYIKKNSSTVDVPGRIGLILYELKRIFYRKVLQTSLDMNHVRLEQCVRLERASTDFCSFLSV